MLRRSLLTLFLLTLAAVLTILVAAAPSDDNQPPPPEWVGENGIVDTSKMPERLKVANSTGDFVGTIDRDEYLRHTGEPLPVIGPDGEIAGHLERDGFVPAE